MILRARVCTIKPRKVVIGGSIRSYRRWVVGGFFFDFSFCLRFYVRCSRARVYDGDNDAGSMDGIFVCLFSVPDNNDNLTARGRNTFGSSPKYRH